MLRIETGYPYYGQSVGVLVFPTTTPRIPGDAGNAKSFAFPVRYEVVQGSFSELIEGSERIRDAICDAVLRLKAQGIRAVVADCGMMSLYQDTVGARTGLPFVGSSLCQIPMIWQMLGRKGAIGVLTGHDRMLGTKHLLSSGWTEEIPLILQGLQEEAHFREIVIEGGNNLNVEAMRADVMNAVDKLMAKRGDIRAIVIECSNLATYSAEIRARTGVQVFDTISAANILAYSVDPNTYI